MKRFFPPRIYSVRAQLMLWNIGALALILGGLGFLLQYSLRTNLLLSIDRELTSRVSPFASMGSWPRNPFRNPSNARLSRRPGNSAGERNAPRVRTGVRDNNPMRIRFFDLEGLPVYPMFDDVPWDAESFHLAVRGEENYKTILFNDKYLRLFSVPVRAAGAVVGVAQGAHPLEESNRVISEMNSTLLMLIPVGLLLAGVGGALLTKRALRPVQDIAQTVERIGVQDLSQRLPIVSADEFARLAASINEMLQRLDSAFIHKEELVQRLEQIVAYQRRFTSDASHELRTPLAIIKANTSLSLRGQPEAQEYREAIEDINHAADTMNRLVQDLLLLARADEAQLGRHVRRIRVREVLNKAVAHLSERKTAPVAILIEDEALTLMANPDELFRVFANLLDNAARHTPLDGRITLKASAEDRYIQIDVIDTGVGIAPEHLPHLGQRFFRADPSRSRPDGGAGLGLSICNNIVVAHGGRIAIKSEVGKGTSVRVRLPAAPALDSPPGENARGKHGLRG